MASSSTALDATPKYDAAVPASLIIQDSQDYTQWGERLRAIATFKERVTEWFAPMKSKALASHREICEKERQTLDPANTDEQRIKRALVAYSAEQDRIRRAERAELERQERQRAEAARLEEAAALELQAKATGDVSLQEAAEHLISAPAMLAPVTPYTPPPPKVEGLSYREVWRFEIVNANAVPRDYLMINEKAIQSVVNGLKDKTNIPGIRVFSEKTTVTRTR